MLAPLHRWDEAQAECRKALDLDPYSVQMAYCAPWNDLFRGKGEQALAEFRRLDAEQPGFFAAGISNALISLGREAEAIPLMNTGKMDFPALLQQNPAELAILAYCFGRVGRTAEALEIERLFQETARTRRVSPGAMSLVYLGLGRMADARRAASQQIEEHSFSVYTLASPIFAPLREDPKFLALLRTTGMPF